MEKANVDLLGQMRKKNYLNSQGVKVMMHDVLIAIKQLEILGRFHGEIYPENIVEQDGRFKLTDIGHSRRYRNKRNRRGISNHYYEYMTPEEIAGTQ